ncbi:MAG: hypothetical protein HQK86_00030 [Nitrospinae bacterium]|nr:hypothetical protein [Nitrospinota bacterium]MBF0633381.1 hypothetical protein [Nitrospinota bacterium]
MFNREKSGKFADNSPTRLSADFERGNKLNNIALGVRSGNSPNSPTHPYRGFEKKNGRKLSLPLSANFPNLFLYLYFFDFTFVSNERIRRQNCPRIVGEFGELPGVCS